MSTLNGKKLTANNNNPPVATRHRHLLTLTTKQMEGLKTTPVVAELTSHQGTKVIRFRINAGWVLEDTESMVAHLNRVLKTDKVITCGDTRSVVEDDMVTSHNAETRKRMAMYLHEQGVRIKYRGRYALPKEF